MRVQNVLGGLLGLLVLAACPPPPPEDPCKDVSCGDHGTCDAETAACVCSGNWEGAACDQAIALEIVGDYIDGWGFDHSVTQTIWTTMGSVFNISKFDNAQRFIIAQNDAANAYNPDLWSRFDWFVDGDAQLYYCQTAFDAADEAAALATAAADSADLAAGCGGYSWSRLDIALEIRGGYVDDWDFNHFVTQDTWTMPGATDSVFHISQFDNGAAYLIAQNDATNSYNPDQWSRFDWVYDSAMQLHYCQTAFDAATEAAALATTAADSSDLAAGCGGYSWSSLGTLDIAGDYSTSSTTLHMNGVSVRLGSDGFAVEVFSNNTQHVVAKNDSSNASNADLYSRFDWFVDAGGDLYLCHTLADGADRAAALATTAADSADLSTGCNGGGWMALSPEGG